MEGSYVPKLAELGVLCMPASFVVCNISEAPGVDAGLPLALGRITILHTQELWGCPASHLTYKPVHPTQTGVMSRGGLCKRTEGNLQRKSGRKKARYHIS